MEVLRVRCQSSGKEHKEEKKSLEHSVFWLPAQHCEKEKKRVKDLNEQSI